VSREEKHRSFVDLAMDQPLLFDELGEWDPDLSDGLDEWDSDGVSDWAPDPRSAVRPGGTS
jgi:hypothetical protein